MYPGIVTKEEFLAAQKIFRKRGETKRIVDKDYPLWRKVKCGSCGRAMPMKSGIVKGVDYRYFYCPHAATQIGEEGCSKEFMREDTLNDIVWESVKGMLASATDTKKILKKQEKAAKGNAKMAMRLSELQKEKTSYEAERFTNMDQFMAGNLDQDVYQSRRAELTQKVEALQKEISNLEEKLHEAEIIRDDRTQAALDAVERFSGATELDQKIVEALIEKVIVYDPEHVEIRWKFSDDVMEILKK